MKRRPFLGPFVKAGINYMSLNKPLRRTLSIGSMVLLLGVGIQGYALFFLGPVLASQLNQRIQEASRGVYVLKQKSASLNLFNGSLVLTDFSLTSDSCRYEELMLRGEIKGSLYEIHVPRLQISGMGVYDAFSSEHLDIRLLRIERPTVKVMSGPREQKDSFRVANLYKLTQGRFTSLRIDKLEIEQGQFQLNNPSLSDQNAFMARDISVQIKNFQIDSTARFQVDKSFYAEEIEVGMDVVDYSFVLPDSTYEIQIGQLGLSTSRREFVAQDITVKPRYEHFLDLRLEGEPVPWLAELRIPRLVMEGVNLHEIYFDQRLELRRVHLQQPGIKLTSSGQLARLEEDMRLPELYPLIRDFLKGVHIDEIEVENSVLDIAKNLEDPRRAAAIRGLELQLLDFRVDSLVENLPFTASDLRLEARDYGFWLAGDDYLLQGKNLWLSTQSRFMLSDSLRLIPSQAVYQAARKGWGQKPEVYETFIPTLMVEGVDIQQLYLFRELDVNKIYLGGPEVWLTNYPRVQKEKVDALARRNFYDFIEGVLYSLTIKDLEIEEGILHFNDQNEDHGNTFTAQEIAVNVNNFRVDSLAQNKSDNPFYADDIGVNFELVNYSLLLPDSSHRVTIGSLGFSAADSSLFGGDILLEPTSLARKRPDSLKQAQYRLYIPRLDLLGLDAKALYFDRELAIRKVSLEQPEFSRHIYPAGQKSMGGKAVFDLDSLPRLLGEGLKSVRVATLEIGEAAVTESHNTGAVASQLYFPNLSIFLKGFYLDSASRMTPDRFGYADDVSVRIQDYTQTLEDSLYRFSLGEMRFSSAQKNIELDSIRLYPIGLSSRRKAAREGGALYDAYIPQLAIKGIPLHEWYYRHRLSLDSIQVYRPVVTVTHYPGPQTSSSDTLPRPDLYKWVSPYLHLLEVKGVGIKEGIFRYRDGLKGPDKDFNARNISVDIAHFLVDSLTAAPFYATEIALGLNVNEYSILLPDSSYEVRAGRIEVSTGGAFITVDSVRLIPQKAGMQGVEMLIPQVQLDGMSFPDLYLNKEIKLAALRFIRPDIRLAEPWKVSTQMGKRLKLPDLYGKFSHRLKNLHIGRIEVQQGSFFALTPQKTPIKVPEFSAVLENFRIDSLSDKRIRQFFFAEEMQMSLSDAVFTSPDSMYDLKIRRAEIHTCDRKILMDSVELFPRFSEYTFGKTKGYSDDRIDLLIPRLQIEGFNAWAAFNQQRFLARKLIADGFQINVFRDRRLPNPTGRKPLLLPEILPQIPLALHLDTLIVLDGRGVYQEHVPDAPQIGWISFGDMFATISPVSNDTLLYQRKEEMVVNVRCKLMDQGIFRIRFNFPLGDTAASHTYTGILEPMDMAAINTITEPATSVKIKSGRVDKLNFSVEANRYRSRGRMRFFYHDFRVQVLNKKKGNQKGIESFMANSFLVRTNNPNQRFLRIGQIEFERDMEKSMFNFLYKTMLSGIASSIGMKKKKDRIKNNMINPSPDIQ